MRFVRFAFSIAVADEDRRENGVLDATLARKLGAYQFSILVVFKKMKKIYFTIRKKSNLNLNLILNLVS